MGSSDVALEASVEKHSKKKSRKKRGAPEPDASITENMTYGISFDGEGAHKTEVEDNEPTMADKLASLDAVVIGNVDVDERQDPSQTAPPSADSVHILLKQALHADDHALLLDCLYNRDDKFAPLIQILLSDVKRGAGIYTFLSETSGLQVIANSVAQLNPINAFKLLDSLISIIQSRGAVLVCALLWLRNLLVLHSSRIMSQESSLITLSSLYQLIESRLGTLSPALQLASSLDFLYSGVEDDGLDEYESAPSVIYEDDDGSEEDESGDDVMDTDEGDNELEELSGIGDVDALEDLAN